MSPSFELLQPESGLREMGRDRCVVGDVLTRNPSRRRGSRSGAPSSQIENKPRGPQCPSRPQRPPPPGLRQRATCFCTSMSMSMSTLSRDQEGVVSAAGTGTEGLSRLYFSFVRKELRFWTHVGGRDPVSGRPPPRTCPSPSLLGLTQSGLRESDSGCSSSKEGLIRVLEERRSGGSSPRAAHQTSAGGRGAGALHFQPVTHTRSPAS